MTIKEAFEALGNACAKGMKNPFFVMKRLKEAFADVADKVDAGGGGSEVSVSTVFSSGVELATITVDDEPNVIYTPFVIGVYDNTEHKVAVWYHDNVAEDVYERTFIKTNLHFDNSMAIIDSSVTTSAVKDILGFEGSVITADGSGRTSLCGLPGMNLWVFGVHVNVNGLGLYGSSANAMEGGKAICTMRYTKPTTE